MGAREVWQDSTYLKSPQVGVDVVDVVCREEHVVAITGVDVLHVFWYQEVREGQWLWLLFEDLALVRCCRCLQALAGGLGYDGWLLAACQ